MSNPVHQKWPRGGNYTLQRRPIEAYLWTSVVTEKSMPAGATDTFVTAIVTGGAIHAVLTGVHTVRTKRTRYTLCGTNKIITSVQCRTQSHKARRSQKKSLSGIFRP